MADDKVFAKYKTLPGIVAERRISVGDLRSVGVEVKEDLVWSQRNRFTVDITDQPEAVKEILQDDPDFTVSNSDAPPRNITGEVSTGGAASASPASAATGRTATRSSTA